MMNLTALLTLVSNVWSCYWRLKADVSSLKQRGSSVSWCCLCWDERRGWSRHSICCSPETCRWPDACLFVYFDPFFSWCDLLLLLSLLIHASSTHWDSSDWLMFNLQSRNSGARSERCFLSRRLSHSLHELSTSRRNLTSSRSTTSHASPSSQSSRLLWG